MKVLLFSLIFFPLVSFAEMPQTSATGPLLANAKAKGYSFEISDMQFAYEPKFVQPAKVRISFGLKEIRKDGEPVPVPDDRKDPDRVSKIVKTFDDLCTDIFDIKAAKIPEATVRSTSYSYFDLKAFDTTCTVWMPAR